MAKAKGGQRVIRIRPAKREVGRFETGPYPAEWKLLPLHPDDLVVTPTSRERNWTKLSWMVSPEGDMFTTTTITGGKSSEHDEAGGIIAHQRFGAPPWKPKAEWEGLTTAMNNGWSSIRWWPIPNDTKGWLAIREAGGRTTPTLKRVQAMVEKLKDMGVPVTGRRVINIDLFGPEGRGRNDSRQVWTGDYGELMSAKSWRDLNLEGAM